MESKKYFPVEESGSNPFRQSEDIVFVQRGNLNARFKKSDIVRFSLLAATVSLIFIVLSIYWISAKNSEELDSERLQKLYIRSRDNAKSLSIFKEEEELRNRCGQRRKKGDCKSIFQRWFYSNDLNSCRPFIYSGCGGNSNNFKSYDECSSVCMVLGKEMESNEDICTLSPDRGPCRGSKIRYFYDSFKKICTKFIYGGCSGNENNFDTAESCYKKCRDNNETHNEEEEDPCSQPKKSGVCRGEISRWYFDKDNQNCKQFIYGGCEGNLNNFLNEEDCSEQCMTQSDNSFEIDICLLQPEKGPCKMRIERFYFDKKSKKCSLFEYGGCKGNKNNFLSYSECEKMCSNFSESELVIERDRTDDEEDEDDEEKEKNFCVLKPDHGECKGYFERYFFDNGMCKKFIYTGCEGNNNNFFSPGECMSVCGDNPAEDNTKAP